MTRRCWVRATLPALATFALPAAVRAMTPRRTRLFGENPSPFVPVLYEAGIPMHEQFARGLAVCGRRSLRPACFTVGRFRAHWEGVFTGSDPLRIDWSGKESPTGAAGFVCEEIA